jgi:hypothetical protein
MNRNPQRAVALLALALAAVALIAAAPPARANGTSALGAEGELFTVVTGRYGDLFPGGHATPPDDLVLALDVARPGSPVERLLVPTTDDPYPEDSAAVILDPASQTPFLVWEHWKNFIHPELMLAQLTATGWSDVTEISGNPFREKSSPTFALTHDSDLRVDAAGELVPTDRTIVHLVWWETAATDDVLVKYAPVVIEDGTYVGWNPVYTLNELATDLEPSAAPSPTEDLAHVIGIAPGVDSRSVGIAFTDAATGRLVSATAHVLPRDLSDLGDTLRDRMVSFSAGLDANDSGCLGALGDYARAQLLDFGDRFQTGFLTPLSDEIRGLIVASTRACDDPGLADDARAQLLDFGDRCVVAGINPLEDAARAQLLDFGDRLQTTPLPDQVRVSLTSARPLPATGAGKTAVFISRTGKNLLVSWEHDGVLSYRESKDGGWSQQFVLRPTGPDGLAAAYQALRDRIADR